MLDSPIVLTSGARVLLVAIPRRVASALMIIALCAGAWGVSAAALEKCCPPAGSALVLDGDQNGNATPDGLADGCHCPCHGVSSALPRSGPVVEIAPTHVQVAFGANRNANGISRAPAGPPPKSLT